MSNFWTYVALGFTGKVDCVVLGPFLVTVRRCHRKKRLGQHDPSLPNRNVAATRIRDLMSEARGDRIKYKHLTPKPR